MRKIISVCLFAVLLLSFNIANASKSYTTDLLNVTVNILPNGDAQITEEWTFTYSGDSFSAFIREIPVNTSQPIKDFSVTEKSTEYKQLPQLTRQDPPGYFAMEKDSRQYTIETYFYAKNQTRTFTLKYTLTNAILMHNDVAEFYYKFIGTTFESSIARITANIYIPEGAIDEDIRVWAHGPLNGTVTKINPTQTDIDVTKVPKGTFVEIRSTMPKELFPQATRFSNSNGLEKILQEEQGWADDANKQRSKAENNEGLAQKILIAVGGIATFMIGAALYLVRKAAKAVSKHLPQNTPKYYRELPSNITPAESNQLIYYLRMFNKQKSPLAYSATLLDLCLKDHLTIKEEQSSGFFSKKKEIYISIDKDKSTADLQAHEITLLNLFKEASQGKDAISATEIKRYFSSNSNVTRATLASFNYQITNQLLENEYIEAQGLANKNIIVLLIPVFIIALIVMYATDSLGLDMEYNLLVPLVLFPAILFSSFLNKISKNYITTAKGASEGVMWEAFQNFLNDFTLFEEKELPDLAVWQSFLVYAVALGQGDKLFKQLQLKYPEVKNEAIRNSKWSSNMNTIYYLSSTDANFFGNFASITNAAVATSTVNMSSGSGRGGGFSGGGGGGSGGGGGGNR